jgi:chlorite dismutase
MNDIDTSAGPFTLWAVYRRPTGFRLGSASEGEELQAAIDALDGATLRGIYDVSGLRADADLMLWLHGPTAEGLQAALRGLRRATVLDRLELSWSAMGVHRDAEFNKQHVPGYMRGVEPRGWLCLYPFVRSFEWYLLDPAERGRMLAEHGRKGAAFKDVIANTVSSFALGDWEWLLPLEADELTDLVDLMRDLRATDARRHVREEIPFYTGRRIPAADVPEVLA